MTDAEIFAAWRTAMGGLSIERAGRLLGLGKRQAGKIATGDAGLRRLHRLALAALAAGLDEWTPPPPGTPPRLVAYNAHTEKAEGWCETLGEIENMVASMGHRDHCVVFTTISQARVQDFDDERLPPDARIVWRGDGPDAQAFRRDLDA